MREENSMDQNSIKKVYLDEEFNEMVGDILAAYGRRVADAAEELNEDLAKAFETIIKKAWEAGRAYQIEVCERVGHVDVDEVYNRGYENGYGQGYSDREEGR